MSSGDERHTQGGRLDHRTCLHCVHFVDDPASIEAQLPNLTLFGSAYSSARGDAGLCKVLDRFLDPTAFHLIRT